MVRIRTPFSPVVQHVCLVLIALLAALPAPRTSAQTVGRDGFADRSFQALWVRTDGPVAAAATRRSWVWGERPGERRYERYRSPEGEVGSRLVQYFDKSRMEINTPTGDRSSPWFVTNGLLVVEMVSGRVQVGNHAFEARSPADVPVAGDPQGNPNAPTYAMLQAIATIDGSNRASSRTGQRVSATYGPGGVGERPDLALPETEIVAYEPVTGHNLPRVFHEFLHTRGPVIENENEGGGDGTVQGLIVDPLFAAGYPITEPYWAEVVVGGEPATVLFQAFERRILTYNPANPEGWRVEMGNVGQHSFRWRYGRSLRYAQPPFPEGVRTRETTLTIPTYAYEEALLPTAPDDPIFPYPRLDRSLVGPRQDRSYRALVVENRFLRLTFLPDLGGRLYQAVDRATGHPLFYQNPVIKPSVFGQRGWWLGVGGMEWAVPTEEHGYLEYLPWEMSIIPSGRGVTVRAETTEQQTGIPMTGRVELLADEGRFTVSLEGTNSTDTAHPFQMWTNAMLSPGGANRIGPDLQFTMPTDTMVVHATEDPGIPGPHETIPWPVLEGRDLRRPAVWNGYLGAFSPSPVPFMGVYDLRRDEGAAVVHGPGTVGAKLFGFSPSFDRSLYTDDGSDYVELWSGAQPTFWDYPPLAPGTTRAIHTAWLPLQGIGSLAVASEDGAVGVVRHEDEEGNSKGTTVALATAQTVGEAVVVVQIDGREVFRSAPLDLRPDLPLAVDLGESVGAGQVVRVEAGGMAWEVML